jgi:hypothetical protein
VQVYTATRNQGWKMQRTLTLHGISYVTPVQGDAAGWSSHFTIHLYDSRTFAASRSKLAIIKEELPIESPPTITMIEVDFDEKTCPRPPAATI